MDNKSKGAWGFQILKTDLKMKLQMWSQIGLLFLLLQGLAAAAINAFELSGLWATLFMYTKESIISVEMPSALPFGLYKIGKVSFFYWLICSPIWCFFPLAIRHIRKRHEKETADMHVDGAKEETIADINAKIKESREPVSLPLGNEPLTANQIKDRQKPLSLYMPIPFEVENVAGIGRPGSGKTQMVIPIIQTLIHRGAKAVILDVKGDLTKLFFTPGRDVLMNPADVRCVGWSVFNEISSIPDIDAVSHSLILPAMTQDPFWHDGARDVFTGTLRDCYQNGQLTNKDIWRAVTRPIGEIAKRLSNLKGGERGYAYIQDASSKMALSVNAVMMQYVKAFEFMSEADGPFSIKQWLEDDKPGFCFITSFPDIKDTLRPVLSLFIDLLCRKLLSMDDDYNRRVFFLLDEFGQLQRLSSLTTFIVDARSKGGSSWLFCQDIGQINKLYGQELRESLYNACGTFLGFSAKDPSTQKYLTERFGRRRFLQTETTRTFGPENQRDGVSQSKREKEQSLVMETNWGMLPKRQAWIDLGHYGKCQVSFPLTILPEKNQRFIMKKQFDLEYIMLEQERIKAAAEKVESDEGGRQEAKQRLKDNLKKTKDKKEKDKGDDDERSREAGLDDAINF